jgi:hypothetical protein
LKKSLLLYRDEDIEPLTSFTEFLVYF